MMAKIMGRIMAIILMRMLFMAIDPIGLSMYYNGTWQKQHQNQNQSHQARRS
jgi:flagellar basal body-associated protein FliL